MDEIPIQFFTNAKVKRYLNQLLAGGLYGSAMSECVERIVARSIEDMITSGNLEETESEEGRP